MSRSSSVDSPLAFTMSPSEAASTAASSPPPSEYVADDDGIEGEDEESSFEEKESLNDSDIDKRLARLEFVLEKSEIYAKLLGEQMDKHKATQQKFIPKSPSKKSRVEARKLGKGKKRVIEETSDEEEVDEEAVAKRQKLADASINEGGVVFQQPALITGAKMKDYQLEGLQWMVALHQNGISGILADEMGLGKTLQTIAFSAYLRQVMDKPFLVVCPLSVLYNWAEEYKKFAPDIPVCMYHGTPAERAELRRTVMDPSQLNNVKAPSLKKRPLPKKRKGRRIQRNAPSDDEEEDQEQTNPANFPVVVTTYEMIINDRVHLSSYPWGYIVVDEGHRLKNLDCKLIREIKKYNAQSRLILTGTPLHNNLAELWSLLNFVLPDIFNDIESFQEWFNLSTMQSSISSERSSHIINKLHTILKPFLLRRLKSDVETNLPPKKEYVLYAPLTEMQKELYNSIVQGTLKGYLLAKTQSQSQGGVSLKESIDVNKPRELRSAKSNVPKKAVQANSNGGKTDDEQTADIASLGREHHRKAALKQINNLRLQNTVMQLRKVCSHPFLFDWPLDPVTMQPTLDDELVDCSGKMIVLERLLDELFTRNHRILLFSQFTTMLDVIEDWATEFKHWPLCRIDGKTSPQERRDQMHHFQTAKADDPKAPNLFLLSTRAGGLGVNLTAADTVIFYDQDWNPQMDAQAQDRAHRIGQTRPVLIFRLVSAHTIETKIMQRATEKRKLEALVIAKGKFKKPAAKPGTGRRETMAEMAAALLQLEAEKIDVVPSTAAGKANVLSDADLEMLLDRRPEVFLNRGVGWTSSDNKQTSEEVQGAEKERGRKTAFEVYQAPVGEGNEVLASMLGEDIA